MELPLIHIVSAPTNMIAHYNDLVTLASDQSDYNTRNKNNLYIASLVRHLDPTGGGDVNSVMEGGSRGSEI